MFTGLFAIIFLALLYGAVKMRVSLRNSRNYDVAENTIASPASKALAELVGIAGGVYLSLILGSSFLKLSVPNDVQILNLKMDPLAAIAIIIACLQPIVLGVMTKLKNN